MILKADSFYNRQTADILGHLFIRIFLLFLVFIVIGIFSDRGPDFENYSDFFDSLREEGWEAASSRRFEIGFSALSFVLISFLSSNVAVYFSMAVLAFSIKWKVLRELSFTEWSTYLLLLVYVTRFFPLHELTQIRIALAISFVVFSLVTRNRLLCVMSCVAGVFFHYSVTPFLIVVMLYRFLKNNDNHRFQNLIYMSLPIGIVAFSLILLFGIELLNSHIPALMMYEVVGYGKTPVNIFSVVLLIDLGILFVCLIFWREMNQRAKFWTSLQIGGVLLYWILSDYPVLAHRFRELISVFWIFLLAELYRCNFYLRFLSFTTSFIFFIIYIYVYIVGPNSLFFSGY